MVSEIDLFPLLKNEFPALAKSLQGIKDSKSPYELSRLFIKYTLFTVENRQVRLTKKCLTFAETILTEGENSVQKAMELIFVPGLAPLISSGEMDASQVPAKVLSRRKKHRGILYRS